MTFKQRIILEGGDEDRQTATLAAVAKTSGGSAFSTNQETVLLEGVVDVIVHSLKDLPTSMPEGLALLPTPPHRQDVRDALCGNTLTDLPKGARVGTGAPRPLGQLLALRPDLEMVPIRGNVPPRLGRLRGVGALDAVDLAAAGLKNRLPDRAPSASRSARAARQPDSSRAPAIRSWTRRSGPSGRCSPNSTVAAPYPSARTAKPTATAP
ncbi:hypothetical protein ABZY03_10865 [Streptomyces klenkii]|uniref:hypothetical protein n=1 Tax=Streptomyces klenkii TaxID=1420899 RepID=UPI0033BEE03F